jgi:hypothetical protein
MMVTSRRSVLVGGSVALAHMAASPLMAQGEVDVAALAALRPGMPAAALQAAYGASWRPPAAHQQGMVDVIENSHHFRARLDVNGVIGEVAYRRQFDPARTIERLHMGMTLEAARLARPGLVLSVLHGGPPTQYGTETLAEGSRLYVEFRFGRLQAIAIVRPGTVYDPKRPVPYPVAEGPPGHPFRDPNFKLVVLSALLTAKAMDIGTPEDLAAHVTGRPFEANRDGYDLLRPAYEYLIRYPLTQAQLDQVTDLTIDGGNAIYRYAYYFWGGHPGYFDVTSIAGIEACANIERFDVIAMANRLDLAPLLGLSRLKLASIDQDDGPFAAGNAAVKAQLRARGVRVG